MKIKTQEEYDRSICAGCAKNSWYFHPQRDGDGFMVSCSSRGDVVPKADCPDYDPKSAFSRFQRWLGIFAFDHRSGFRCYDISREDFFTFIFSTLFAGLVLGAIVGYFAGSKTVTVDYNYIEFPDAQKTYYFEKEDYDYILPFVYRRAIFEEDNLNNTTIKLAPLRFTP